MIFIVDLSNKEEQEIRDFISLLRPIELEYNHEMNTINWGLHKVESFIHRFEIPEPYKHNLSKEVEQLRKIPFPEDVVIVEFHLIADILEEYLKYIKRIEIEETKKVVDLSPELSRLSRKLRIKHELLIDWLDNFQSDEQPYAMKLLEHIKRVSFRDLKEICQELYKKILEHSNLEDLVFVSIGGEAKSDKYISYYFRLYNEIPETQFINKLNPKLTQLQNRTIIYLDDISGTGNQFCDDWNLFIKNFDKDFFQSNKFVFAPLFVTEKARREIEENL